MESHYSYKVHVLIRLHKASEKQIASRLFNSQNCLHSWQLAVPYRFSHYHTKNTVASMFDETNT